MGSKPLSSALSDKLAQDVIRAVTDAFTKTFGVTVKTGHYQIGEGTVALSGDVSGVVGFVQDKLEGTLTACFEMKCLKHILPRLLGDDIEVTQEVVMDAVGEITNMIFGQIKTELNQRGYQLRFGMPSVIKGPGHFIGHMHEGTYMIMAFDVDGHAFQVHLAFHSSGPGF
jgi:chemotaxis protein CheX